jgi:hypothetical protein
VESHPNSLCRLIRVGLLRSRLLLRVGLLFRGGLLLALLGPTAFASIRAVVVVNNLAIIVIIIEGIIVGNPWLVTVGDALPGARVGVNLSP